MTYTPGIPNATDNISVSQGQIKTNFQQLDTIFANDHYAFDDATSGGAYRGYHKQVYFPVQEADPALGGFAGVLYPKNDPNDTAARAQIYYRNITQVYQVTNRFFSATVPGYVMVNGGVIMMWGSLNVSSSGQYAVTFSTMANYVGGPVGFPNAVFSVQVTLQSPSAAASPPYCLDQTSPPTSTGFSLRISSSVANTTAYWFAIGN